MPALPSSEVVGQGHEHACQPRWVVHQGMPFGTDFVLSLESSSKRSPGHLHFLIHSFLAFDVMLRAALRVRKRKLDDVAADEQQHHNGQQGASSPFVHP